MSLKFNGKQFDLRVQSEDITPAQTTLSKAKSNEVEAQELGMIRYFLFTCLIFIYISLTSIFPWICNKNIPFQPFGVPC